MRRRGLSTAGKIFDRVRHRPIVAQADGVPENETQHPKGSRLEDAETAGSRVLAHGIPRGTFFKENLLADTGATDDRNPQGEPVPLPETTPAEEKRKRAAAGAPSVQSTEGTPQEAPREPLTPKDEKKARVARGNILFFFAVLVALLLAYKLRHALGIIYVSALFAVVLMPVVQQIQRLEIGRFRFSRAGAVVTLVLAVFASLTVFLVVALPPVLHDVEHFSHDFPERVPGLLARLERVPLVEHLGIDQLSEKAEGGAGLVAKYIIATAPKWLARILDLLTAMILCIYFMLEGEFAYFYLLALFPEESRDRLAKTLLVAEARMSKWLIGQGALMLILGVSSTIVFGLLHVRYFFLLGMLMGLFNIIPVAGGVITIVLAAGVAATDSLAKMAGVLIFYAIYVQIENAFLTPHMMKTSVNLMGLGVLIALLCGTELAGVVGAMVAVPTAALVAVLMDEYMVETDPDALADAATAQEKVT